jgi:hypothetical protein
MPVGAFVAASQSVITSIGALLSGVVVVVVCQANVVGDVFTTRGGS